MNHQEAKEAILGNPEVRAAYEESDPEWEAEKAAMTTRSAALREELTRLIGTSQVQVFKHSSSYSTEEAKEWSTMVSSDLVDRIDNLIEAKQREAVRAFAERLKNYPIKQNGFGNERLGSVVVMLEPEESQGKYHSKIDGIVDDLAQLATPEEEHV